MRQPTAGAGPTCVAWSSAHPILWIEQSQNPILILSVFLSCEGRLSLLIPWIEFVLSIVICFVLSGLYLLYDDSFEDSYIYI